MTVNLYDFDGTIYDGDSSIDFYKFCLKSNFRVVRFLPLFVVYFLLYKLKFKTKEEMKEKFFAFICLFLDINEQVEKFWDVHRKKLKQFYLLKIDHSSDIILSASPSFLLQPICNSLGVKDVIASDVDKKTGKYIGKNCMGRHKVECLKKKYPDILVKEAYSDSKKDMPMLLLAQKSYFVKKNTIIRMK